MPQNPTAVLNEALGRTGAAALPYAPEFKYLVQQHMLDLVTDLPSLHVKTREYVHIDGRTAQLLLAEGTLPMYYQGQKYNIPVAIWLPEQYPLAAPTAYVVPTPDMVIKPRHSFVDASGLVHTLYISQWQYPASNLRDMAQDMSINFGGDPPLFSKPKNWNAGGSGNLAAAAATPLPARPPAPGAYGAGGPGTLGGDTLHVHNPLNQSAAFGPYGSSSFTSTSSGPVKPAAAANSSLASGGFESVWAAMMAASDGGKDQQGMGPAVQQQQAAAQPPPPKENPSVKLKEAFRAAAIASLNKRLNVSLTALAGEATAQAKEQLELQTTLRQRGEQLQAEVAGLQAERVALDRLSQELAASNAQLDRWLADNERLAKAAEDPSQLDPDTIITAADPLSQQALEVQAQDLGLEDALYALDKALNAGRLEADAYLKQVRAVCRRQFFVRVCGVKVAAQQEQQRKAAPPQQQQQFPSVQADMQRQLSAGRPVVLPQGDSWANAGIMPSSSGGGGAWYPAT